MGNLFAAIVGGIVGFGIGLLICGSSVKEDLQQAFDEGYQAGRNSK